MAASSSTPKKLLIISLLWLGAAGSAAFEFWDLVPHSLTGIIGLLVLGPPALFLAEMVAHWIWFTDPAGKQPRFSSPLARIAVGVLVGGICIAAFAWWSLSKHGAS